MSSPQKVRNLVIFAWALSVLVVVVAFIAWGQGIRWKFAGLSSYRLFPLFGLLAFSLMWAHYVVAAVRQYLDIGRDKVARYFEITSLMVLVAILAHPGILWWQLWRDGFGLPPSSYIDNYVAPGLAWVAALGTISLVVFLVYEFRRFYEGRKWWRIVQYASDVAILAIVYHSFRLGSNLQRGWFKTVWLFYAVSLILALVYIYWLKVQKRHSVRPAEPVQSKSSK